jgi:hypothetical protein
MFFAEAQIRVHLYGQPTDMRNYVELIVMRTWRRSPCAPLRNRANITAHNVTGGRHAKDSASPGACRVRGIGLA